MKSLSFKIIFQNKKRLLIDNEYDEIRHFDQITSENAPSGSHLP